MGEKLVGDDFARGAQLVDGASEIDGVPEDDGPSSDRPQPKVGRGWRRESWVPCVGPWESSFIPILPKPHTKFRTVPDEIHELAHPAPSGGLQFDPSPQQT